MSIIKNISKIAKVYKGSDEIISIYKGSDKVYTSGPEIYTVSFNDLINWFKSVPENSANDPYYLNITDIPSDKLGSSTSSGNNLGTIIRNFKTKYVNLENTILPDNVTSLAYTFQYCSNLTASPAIPNAVTSLLYTFYGCTSLIVSPNIPSKVINLNNAFRYCSSLIAVKNVPNTITNLGYSFANCSMLDSIYNFNVIGSKVTSKTLCFSNTPSTLKVYVPSSYLSYWKTNYKSFGANSPNIFIAQ